MLRTAAVVAALGLAGAACGSGDGGGEEAEEGDTGAATTEAPQDEGEPQPGGSLVYGIEADTGTPWTPQNSLCAIACHTVMKSVYDSLTVIDAEGVAQPNVAESVEPNEDFTVWTITPRAGVTFHDGAPFDAEAICFNLQASKDSPLTGRTLADVDTIAVSADGAACELNMLRPWATFDYLISGQVGYMASPQWLEGALTDPTIAAQPVGTGPFTFESYTAGASGSYVGVKNAEYWRADEGLPYLDRIEFRVFQDGESRVNAVRDGAVDIMHTSNPQDIAELREDTTVEMVENDNFGETGYTMLNVGDPESEISDVRVRRAMASAVDPVRLQQDRNAGILQTARGPFSPDQDGFIEPEELGYPEYDVAAATALIEEYETETGRQVEIDFLTTADPYNLETNQYVAAQWEAVGITVNLNQVEQSQYILNAALGSFEAFAWRNHGGYTLDSQRSWWHTESSRPIGEISTNFGRISDPGIDAALDRARESDDPEVQAEAAEEVNRIFAEQVYNLWGSYSLWAMVTQPEVNGVTAYTVPGGEPGAFGQGGTGSHPVAQLWVEQ